VAKFLTELFAIKQKFTSGYHPQTNGRLTERFNRTIIDELAKVLNEKKDDWVDWLPAKFFAYNTSVQKSTGYTPFEMLHTFTPRTPMDLELVQPPDIMKQKRLGYSNASDSSVNVERCLSRTNKQQLNFKRDIMTQV